MKPQPVNLKPMVLPRTLTIGNKKCRMRLAAKDKIFQHQTDGYFLVEWKDLYKATNGKICRTPQYPEATAENGKGGKTKAEIRPGMYAMAIPVDKLKEKTRKEKERFERKGMTQRLKSKQKINKMYRDHPATPNKDNVVHGEHFDEADRWAGKPEGKIQDEKPKVKK